MVRYQLIEFIQKAIDKIITTYTETINNVAVYVFDGYTCKIHGDINYQFLEPEPKQIEASIIFGSITKNNDLEDKYNQKFTINIASEINGGKMAMKLFNIFFQQYTRTYFPNTNINVSFGDYKGKMFYTSPVYMGKYQNMKSNFIQYMVVNSEVEFAKYVVLGATYSLSLSNGSYFVVKPRQPYALREAMGGIDTKPLMPSYSFFSKSSNQTTINLVLLYETTGATNHDTLFNSLLTECYEPSSTKYKFKCVVGSLTFEMTNMICVRGQHIYDEATGENVLSLQFKVAT